MPKLAYKVETEALDSVEPEQRGGKGSRFFCTSTLLLPGVVITCSNLFAFDIRAGEPGVLWAWICVVMGQQRTALSFHVMYKQFRNNLISSSFFSFPHPIQSL